MNESVLSEEQRSPVRRLFASLCYGLPVMHVALVATDAIAKLKLGNWRRTGDRRSLQR
jgi:hypothetical protein